MKPSLENGDLLLAVSRSSIQRFDLVVFKDPENPRRHMIKRLVALSGEKLTVQDGRILINDQPLETPKGSSEPALLENFTFQTPWDCCFVLGDNPYSSKDSRHFGPIPIRHIWARVLCKIWPLPGKAS
jgi:signal peptidase I